MEPLKNTGKLYFYYFLVVFIFISRYVIFLLSLHAGGTFYIFLQNGIISIMTILYIRTTCIWFHKYIYHIILNTVT